MTSALSGAYLLQDVDSLSESIRSGDWAATAMNLLSTGLDTAAAIMDPIGTLLANGLGWLMDHLQPLKGWLDDLTGHADQVRAFAKTWKGVEADLHAAGGHYQSSLASFDPITGVAASTYKELGVDIAKHVNSAGNWSGAIATGLDIAATLVETVHDLVRDVLSQIVGSLLVAAGEALATVGVGLAEIIPALITRVGELAVRIGKDVTTVIETVKSLTSKIHTLAPEIERIGKEMAEALRNFGKDAAAGGVAAAGAKRLATLGEDGLTRHPTVLKVEFDYKPHFNRPEWDRQLDNAQGVLDNTTFQTWLDRRDVFDPKRTTAMRNEQDAVRADARTEKMRELIQQGVSPSDARAQAEAWVQPQHAIHRLDGVAGGDRHDFDGVGDGRVNSAIGSQWRHIIPGLEKQVRELASTMTPEQLRTTLLNIRISG